MASRRYALAVRLPAAGQHRFTVRIVDPRRLLAATRVALSLMPFLFILWVGMTVLVARGEALPGVHVGAVHIGGLDADEAHAAVERHYADVLAQPIELVVDGTTWTPTGGEMGFSIQPLSAIDRAMAYGREHQVIDGMLRAMRMPAEKVVIPVNVAVDARAFDAWLDRIERELGGEPVDASVVFDGGRIEVTEAAVGRGIDREIVRRAVAEQLVASRGVSLDIARSPQEPAIPTERAAQAATTVERIVAEPLVLVAGDDRWEIEPATILSIIEIAPDSTAPGTLVVRVQDGAVSDIVDAIAVEIDRETRDARIEDSGTHSKLVPSQDGRTVDRVALVANISLAISSDEREIAVPFTVNRKATITTEDVMRELGITDLIAVGDSLYTGSGSGRAHNVEQAARMIDGTLVEPGGTFSFNDAVGSLFSGEYRDGMSYIDGLIEPSLAGGVCQVTTTVFRAVLTTGFPVLEWYPHFYRSPYYELGGWGPGWDAAITQFEPDSIETSTDFRFVNPTDSWLLIRANVSDGDALTVEIHGAPTGYDVWFDQPVIETVEWATDEVTVTVDSELPPGTILPDQPKMDGLRVTVVRHVAIDGDVISVDTFTSTYGAYGPIRRVSPDMEASAWSQ